MWKTNNKMNGKKLPDLRVRLTAAARAQKAFMGVNWKI